MAIALLRRHPLSDRLWQGGGIIGCIVLSIIAANFFLPAEKSVGRTMLGHDFLAFYTAGSFAADGKSEQLYDLEAVRLFQKSVASRQGLEVGDGFGPFWNPPFYAWVFAPLSGMPYLTAATVWISINAACALVAIAMMCRMIRAASHPWPTFHATPITWLSPAWKFWLLVPLLTLFSMPFIQTLSHGQNTCVSLLILTTAVTLWRKQRALLAGIVGGLLFYKPQLGAILACAMAVSLGRRAIVGLALTGVSLLAVTELTMPGVLRIYLQQMPENIASFQIFNPYLWERHVTLKAFWRMLLQGHTIGPMSMTATALWIGSIGIIATGLIAAFRVTRRKCADDVFGGVTAADRRARFIAATIIATPLLMPFYFDYDLLLLAVPFTLLAAERLRREDVPSVLDRAFVAASAMLYVWLMVNPGLARESELNVSVILLTIVSGVSIWHACQKSAEIASGETARETISFRRIPPAPLRRAA